MLDLLKNLVSELFTCKKFGYKKTRIPSHCIYEKEYNYMILTNCFKHFE